MIRFSQANSLISDVIVTEDKTIFLVITKIKCCVQNWLSHLNTMNSSILSDVKLLLFIFLESGWESSISNVLLIANYLYINFCIFLLVIIMTHNNSLTIAILSTNLCSQFRHNIILDDILFHYFSLMLFYTHSLKF